MENFKDLLIITPEVCEYKDIIRVELTWVYDGTHDGLSSAPYEIDEFFEDKKLIWLLAYLDMFGVEDKKYINSTALYDVVCDEYGLCDQLPFDSYTLSELKVTYYDENCNPFSIKFDNIHERWKTMTEEEVCREVNDVLLNN